jgi:uncharacterized membrane protein YphA (DoxX/SURF4 family)
MRYFDRKDATALFILRLGLVWFMFLWAVHKILTPGQYQQLAKHFDGVDISYFQIYATGVFQIVLCLLAFVGAFRLVSYGGLALMHFYTLTRRWDGFFDPFALNDQGFPVHRNQVIDLAVMGAFIALILLIHRDHFSIGGWLRRHQGARWWQ